MSSNQYKTFQEFWPYYLSEHGKLLTRRFHFVGTSCALLAVLTAIFMRDPFWLAIAFVAGYAPAWISHFGIERNRPATFTYPLWSLIADFKMWFLILTQRPLK